MLRVQGSPNQVRTPRVVGGHVPGEHKGARSFSPSSAPCARAWSCQKVHTLTSIIAVYVAFFPLHRAAQPVKVALAMAAAWVRAVRTAYHVPFDR